MTSHKPSLAETHPELAAQAHGWDPTTLTAWSKEKVGWKCELGHTWVTSVQARKRGSGCPYCAGQKPIVGLNDLTTTHSELAAQADGWDPATAKAGTKKKMKWRCQMGHNWNAVVSNRALKRSGCPVCSNQKVLSGFNDLATTHPELAAQADGWEPSTVTRGSEYKRRWKCEFGHIWMAVIVNRANLGQGCAVCAGKQINIGINDIATTHPEIAAEAHGWDPRKFTSHSGKKVKWKCSEGHIWTAMIANRSNGRGCPTCSHTGFDPNQPGFIYFIDHFDLQMFQIGITNSPEDRLDDHKRRGWEVSELRGPMDGHLTRKLETDLLRALEKRGAILGHKAGIEKFDGHTEAWTKASLNVTSIKQILDWVYEDDNSRGIKKSSA